MPSADEDDDKEVIRFAPQSLVSPNEMTNRWFLVIAAPLLVFFIFRRVIKHVQRCLVD